jgi:hypothetical protein
VNSYTHFCNKGESIMQHTAETLSHLRRMAREAEEKLNAKNNKQGTPEHDTYINCMRSLREAENEVHYSKR